MNTYMNCVALRTFSLFCPGMPDELPVDVYPADADNKPSDAAEPKRFYHGFVLGLMVDLTGKYVLTSNRESGFGRYDVMLVPRNKDLDAIILEFKVFSPRKEKKLEITPRNVAGRGRLAQSRHSVAPYSISRPLFTARSRDIARASASLFI